MHWDVLTVLDRRTDFRTIHEKRHNGLMNRPG